MCDSDVACAVKLQKHTAVKHMAAQRKWPGKDTPVKFTTQPQMRRHRGGAETLEHMRHKGGAEQRHLSIWDTRVEQSRDT